MAAVTWWASTTLAAADPVVPVTIVAFGDSTTAPRGSLAVYSDILKELYGKPPYHPDNPDGLNGLLDSYAEAVRQVALQTGAVLVDARAAFLAEGRKPGGSLDSLLLDGLHPNDEGHRVVAELLRAQLLALAGKEGLAIQPGATRAAPREATAAPVDGMKPAGSGLEINIRATEMPSLRTGPFVRLGNGDLLCLQETNCWLSADEGATWQARPLFAATSGFKIDESTILRTSKGTDTFPLTGGDRRWSATPVSNHRGELSIAFTEDECKTWSVPVVVARKPGAWLSYPFVFEVAPGELYITTMQGGVRLKLREADFRAPSGQTTPSKSRT